MRRWLWLFLLAVPALGQVVNPSIISVATAPSGACSAGLPNQQVTSTGVQYSCQGGTWGVVGGGGGSYLPLAGGTVTGNVNVNGTGSSPSLDITDSNKFTSLSINNTNSTANTFSYTPLNSTCQITTTQGGYCYGAIVQAENFTTTTDTFTHTVGLETETTVGNAGGDDAYGVAVGLSLQSGQTIPGSGVRVEFGNPTSYTGKTTFGFNTQDGIATIGLDLGGTCQSNALNSGTNLTCSSQPVNLHGVNAGTDGPEATMTADDLGNLTFVTPGGQATIPALVLGNVSSSTSPVCPNGTNGRLTTVGCTATAGASYYQTVQQAGTPLAQEPIINFTSNMTCTDNPGTTSTNCAPSSSIGSTWASITNGANTQTGAFSSTAPWTFSAAGVASVPGMTVSGAPYAGGSTTTNFPQVYLNSGTAPTTFSSGGTDLGINSPSGFAGNAIDVHLNGGTSLFSVNGANGVAGVAGAQVADVALAVGTVAWAGSPANAYGLYALTPTGATNNYGLEIFNSSASTSLLKVDSSGDVIANANFQGGKFTITDAFESAGTKFTTSGCSVSSTTGGATAGVMTLGANTCSVVITLNGATGITAPHGWSCNANDETTAAGNTNLYFSANSTTTATLSVPATAGTTDVVDFACTAF